MVLDGLRHLRPAPVHRSGFEKAFWGREINTLPPTHILQSCHFRKPVGKIEISEKGRGDESATATHAHCPFTHRQGVRQEKPGYRLLGTIYSLCRQTHTRAFKHARKQAQICRTYFIHACIYSGFYVCNTVSTLKCIMQNNDNFISYKSNAFIQTFKDSSNTLSSTSFTRHCFDRLQTHHTLYFINKCFVYLLIETYHDPIDCWLVCEDQNSAETM